MLDGIKAVAESVKESIENVGETIKESVSELTEQKEAALAENDAEYANYYESCINETELGTHQGEKLEMSDVETDPEYAKYYEQNESKQGKGEVSFGGRSGIERAKSDIKWAAEHGFERQMRDAQRKLANEYVKEAAEKAKK